MKRIAFVLVSVLTLSGCVNAFVGAVAESAGIPLSSNEVASKMEPNVLVARTGETCVVTKGRWEKAEPGDDVLCAWSGDLDKSGRIPK